MSKTTTTILERVQEMTRQAREREAAKQGYCRAVIAPVKPLDLTKTDTVKATVAQLQKDGFKVEWEVWLQPDNTSYQALVVTW